MNPKDIVGASKPDISLVPGSAIVYAALGMGNGAEKYGPYNWRDYKVQARAYTAAIMRHILAWQDGEERAEDSGLPHLAHAISGLAILIDAIETGNVVDNRPKAGETAGIIKRHTRQIEKTVV